MGTKNHDSHGFGPVREGHHGTNIAQNGAPKRVHAIEVHPGMKTKSQIGADALSGHEASAIDSLTGNACVPGKVTATPGWGNAFAEGAANGHPLAKAPGAKRLTVTAPAFGQRSRGPNADKNMHALGAAMLAEAFSNSAGDDCQAHGRNKDGSKC